MVIFTILVDFSYTAFLLINFLVCVDFFVDVGRMLHVTQRTPIFLIQLRIEIFWFSENAHLFVSSTLHYLCT